MTFIGPNAKKLLAHFIAREAVPPGGGFASGLEFILDQEKWKIGVQIATEKMREAIKLIKAAPDNPYGDDDEAIAAAILKEVEKKKAGKK